MIAVILGSTGMVGSLLVAELLQSSYFVKVISITRKSLNIYSEKHHEFLIHDLVELQDLKLESAGAVFFCCVGSTLRKAGSRDNFRKVDYSATLDFAKLAARNNATKFILISSMGANRNSFLFYNRTKGEVEEAILDCKLKGVTVFRPGLLLGQRQEMRLAELASIWLINLFSKVIDQEIMKKFSTKPSQLVYAMIRDGMAPESGYKIVESSEI